MATARETALNALYCCHKEGGWSEGALRRELCRGQLDSRDAALASRLCYGVLQQQLLLDHYLSHICSLPLEKLEPKVLEVLRLGAYQLLWMDKIPARAAVDESVKLTRRVSRSPRAAGLVNAVLRNLDRGKETLPPPSGDWADRASVTFSHPKPLVEEFARRLGQAETERLLEANNRMAPITAQVNTTKCTAAELAAALTAQGVEVTPHAWLPDCLILEKTGDMTKLEPFARGWFYIQDPAARLAVWAAAPKPGERVLDLCAAPGGKSFAAAIAMGDRGTVVSRDLYPRKVSELRHSAARLGLSSIQGAVGDATKAEEGHFDLVIADVPCSGLGIIRKKPEIRYKALDELAGLLPIQEKILENAAALTAPSGRLLYATCTLRPEENEAQVARFLEKAKDFTPIPLELPSPFGRVEAGQLTLWPHRDGTDGFFFALLGRCG